MSWPVPAILALVAVAVRLPLLRSSRSLVFDDGQYGVTVVGMRHGLAPYRDLFSSQGPLHFPLLYAGDLLGGRTLHAPRTAPLVAGIAASVGVWAIARRLGAPERIARVAGLLVATTGTMLWTTGQVTGDGPAAGFVVAAVWAALVYRDDPGTLRAVVTGALFGGALAVKPLVVTAAIPIGTWLWAHRRQVHVAAAGAAATAVWFAAALPWGLGRVWRQSVTYHTGAGPEFDKWFQLRKLFSLLGERDAVLVVAVVLGLVAAARGVGAAHSRRGDAVVLGVWCAVVAVVLVAEKALFANHLATIVVPLVLVFAVRPPPLRWLAAALVVVVPWNLFWIRDMLRPGVYRGAEAALVHDLRALPRGARVIADDPAFVWHAGLATPRLMNDVSKKRIDQGLLTTGDVVAAARAPGTCAVVVWTFRFGSLLPGLRAGLAGAGYRLAREYAPHRELWQRECPSRPAAPGRAVTE